MSPPLTSIQAKLQIALVASPDPVYVIDANGLKVVEVNELSCQALGDSREEMLDMSVPDIDLDVTEDGVRSNIQRLDHAKRPILIHGRHFRNRGGKTNDRAPEEQTKEKTLNPHFVEDNKSNLQLMRTIFDKREKCKLTLSESAADAIERSNADIPDMFLLDVNLPDSAGTELLEKIRSEPLLKGVPVIVVSADANPSMINAFEALGVLDYLTKPADVQRLLTLIESLKKVGAERT